MANYLILSCDGGGIRGLLTALVLKKLQDRHQILDRVDLVAGTSTGGIIALAITGEVPIEDVVGLYRKKGGDIFKPFVPPVDGRNRITEHLTRLIRVPRNDPEKTGFVDTLLQSKNELWYPRYDHDGLESVLGTSVFKSNPTLQVLGRGKRVLVTTPRLGSERDSWAPIALHNFPSDGAEPVYPEVRPGDIHVVEAALCTSAAPVYFPPYHHLQLGYFVDGGLFANNPGSLALAMAIRRAKQPLESIRMLSIGTGGTHHSMPIPHHPVFRLKEQNYGILAWLYPKERRSTPAFPLLSAIMEAGALADSYVCQQILAESKPPGNYLRIQPPLSTEIGLDDYLKVDQLESAADAYTKSPEWDSVLAWVETQFRK